MFLRLFPKLVCKVCGCVVCCVRCFPASCRARVYRHTGHAGKVDSAVCVCVCVCVCVEFIPGRVCSSVVCCVFEIFSVAELAERELNRHAGCVGKVCGVVWCNVFYSIACLWFPVADCRGVMCVCVCVCVCVPMQSLLYVHPTCFFFTPQQWQGHAPREAHWGCICGEWMSERVKVFIFDLRVKKMSSLWRVNETKEFKAYAADKDGQICLQQTQESGNLSECEITKCGETWTG